MTEQQKKDFLRAVTKADKRVCSTSVKKQRKVKNERKSAKGGKK